MTGLFNAPYDVWCDIFSDWLDLKSLGRIDSAFLNTKSRPTMLELLRTMTGVTVYSPKRRLGAWLYDRSIRLRNLVLSDQTFVGGQLPFKVHFDLVYELQIHNGYPASAIEKEKKILILAAIVNSCMLLKILLINCFIVTNVEPSVLHQLDKLVVSGSPYCSMEEVHRHIIDNCRNLKEFLANSSDYSSDFCRQLLKNNSGLTALRVPFSDNDMLDTLMQCSTKLESLHLEPKTMCDVTSLGKLLNSIPTLKQLNVNVIQKRITYLHDSRRKELVVRKYEASDLKPFIMSFYDLTLFELAVEAALQPEVLVIQVLKHSCTTLRYLKLSECSNLSLDTIKRALTRCPSLIELSFKTSLVPGILKLFTECGETPQRLERLMIDCPNMGLSLVMDILLACPALKFCVFHNVSEVVEMQDKFRKFMLTSQNDRKIEVVVYFGLFAFDRIPTMRFKDGEVISDVIGEGGAQYDSLYDY